MDYSELKHTFQDLKRNFPLKDLTAHIIFTEDSFDQQYPLLSRTYRISSANKAYWPNMGGYSIFGDTCIRVRESYERNKIRLEPVTGDQVVCGEWAELSIDRVYGYRTLLERYVNYRDGSKARLEETTASDACVQGKNFAPAHRLGKGELNDWESGNSSSELQNLLT